MHENGNFIISSDTGTKCPRSGRQHITNFCHKRLTVPALMGESGNMNGLESFLCFDGTA